MKNSYDYNNKVSELVVYHLYLFCACIENSMNKKLNTFCSFNKNGFLSKYIRQEFKEACSHISFDLKNKQFITRSFNNVHFLEKSFSLCKKLIDKGTINDIFIDLKNELNDILHTTFDNSIVINSTINDALSLLGKYLEELKQNIQEKSFSILVCSKKESDTVEKNSNTGNYMQLEGGETVGIDVGTFHLYNLFVEEKNRINEKIIAINNVIGSSFGKQINNVIEETDFNSEYYVGLSLASFADLYLNDFLSSLQLCIHKSNIKRIKNVNTLEDVKRVIDMEYPNSFVSTKKLNEWMKGE